ncbi:MAG: hypothetical protein JWQ38_2352 [Flavipsychrobacter sp.]|nr:hypothetical protein [Flavipsychrobacter sp.]
MKRFSVFILFLLIVQLCSAQQQGCFKRNAKGYLSIEGNIDMNSCNSFFVGEFHGVYGVSEVKLAIIKYAHEHNDVGDIFMEIGYSTTWLYNRYLQTGDTTLFTSPILTYAQKQVNRKFWKQLYEYNSQLKHKLVIHGMDFERMDFIKALKLLMPEGKEKPAEIRTMLCYIDTTIIKSTNAELRNKGHTGQLLNTMYDSIRKDIVKQRNSYKSYYGKNFDEVERIMFNRNTFKNYAERNEGMYTNVMKAVKEEKIKRFIVFAGLNHANKEGGYTLCSKLKNTAAIGKKIVTISMICKDCYDWQQPAERRYAAFRAPLTYVSDTVLLGNIYRRHFKAGCTYNLLRAADDSDKRVGDFSDYVILMKDQPEF